MLGVLFATALWRLDGCSAYEFRSGFTGHGIVFGTVYIHAKRYPKPPLLFSSDSINPRDFSYLTNSIPSR